MRETLLEVLGAWYGVVSIGIDGTYESVKRLRREPLNSIVGILFWFSWAVLMLFGFPFFVALITIYEAGSTIYKKKFSS